MNETKEPPTRRRMLRSIGLALVAAPLGKMLIGCGSSDSAVAPGTDSGSGGDTNGASDATGADTATGTETGSATSWATGGTASMKGGYRDPFAAGLGTTCKLTCSATLGPCYAKTLERKDISEGQPGLPVRLALIVVDESCKPIAGATVDIWHCGPTGLYSGDDASDFCTTGDAGARAARYFRGVQTTDTNGRVDFDTCFPGWYSSRTIHIHFTIRIGGTEYVTSQLVFDDALDDEIVSTQPVYSARGKRDTTNATDNVVNATTAPDYSFQTERQADGAMLAWKAIVVRSSTSSALCNIGR